VEDTTPEGWGVCDDGLVIDLSRIRYTHVDPQNEKPCGSEEAAPGATSTTPPMPLAWRSPAASFPPRCRRPDPGRRLGYLTRKYGLAIDNLIAADVVLADGRL